MTKEEIISLNEDLKQLLKVKIFNSYFLIIKYKKTR